MGGTASNDDVAFVLQRAERVLDGKRLRTRQPKFKRYALASLSDGVGKSTLAFNLAYEVSRAPTLMIDACPQKDLSRLLFGNTPNGRWKTLYDSLVTELVNAHNKWRAPAHPVHKWCKSFADRKCYAILGSERLYFASSLVSGLLDRLAVLEGDRPKDARAAVLQSLRRAIEQAASEIGAERVLVDSGQWFDGMTHLAWMAADGLVVPVRVDQRSIDAFQRTLQLLADDKLDLQRRKREARLDDRKVPLVHTVVVTHCGWGRESPNTRDSTTVSFIRRIVGLAKEYRRVFSEKDVRNSIYLLDDLHAAGRVSGARRTPISVMSPGDRFRMEGEDVKINDSIIRYQRQLRAIAEAL